MSFKNDALASVIRNRLMRDSRIGGLTIDIYCNDGYVSLIGEVDSEEQKELIIKQISGLVGVRYVIDRIKLRSSVYA